MQLAASPTDPSPGIATPDDAELARLASLESYDLLAAGPEVAYDELVALAADITGAPMALVTLIGREQQWFKAAVGIDADGTHRDTAICDWAIRSSDPLFVVPDASEDPRFSRYESVVGEMGVRFYAGVPVRSHDGHGLGTVCVVDTEPRPGLTPSQERGLLAIARQVERLFELRRVSLQLLRSQRWSKALVDQAADLVLVTDDIGNVTFASAAASPMLGYDPVADVGTNVLDLVHPDDVGEALGSFAATVESAGLRDPFELRVAHRDGTWRWVEVVANNQLDDRDIGGIVLHVRDASQRHAAEELVRARDHRLAEAQRVARMGSWEIELRTGEMVWSDGLCALFGLDPASAETTIASWQATMRPGERDDVFAVVRTAIADGLPFSFRRHVLRPDGVELLVQCHGEVERDDAGEVCRLRGTAIDITEQVALERSLDGERRFLRAVLDNLDEGVVACDADGVLTLFNPATERLHGGRSVIAMGLERAAEVYDLFAADGVTSLAVEDVPLHRAFTHGRVEAQEMVIAPAGAEKRLVSCSGQAIVDDAGERLGAVVTMRDVTAQRLLEQRLRRMADHDVLTGLPNRAVLTNRLEAGLARREPMAVLFIDLDDFKRINDEHGHNTGDKVLGAVADRLRGAVKEGDMAVRLGGDEFVVFLAGVDDEATVAAVAGRLRTSIGGPVKAGDLLVHPGASVGWAVASGAERSAEALLSRADNAMYVAKQAARSTLGR